MYRRTILSALSTTLLLLAAASAFGQSSQFSATCQIGAPTTQGNDVTVTISAKITNKGTEDASDVTVTLANLTAKDEDFGSFPAVTVISAGGSVVLSQDFTLPQWAYDSWQNGGAPVFSVSYTVGGNNASEYVQATFVSQP
jgi:hypothetical protein